MNSQKERVPITVNRHTDVQYSKSINMQDYRLAAYPTDYCMGTGTWSKKYVHTVLQQWDAAL